MTDREMAGLRLERQHLLRPADETAYEALYRDLQPGLNVYWCGFGQPPTLSFRAAFDDLSYNRERQRRRELLKGRFQGGNLGWVDRRDWELYAGLYRKPLERFSDRQRAVLELLEREGPLNIQLIKEATGMLVKEITPVLHRLQEAFLVYEDQYDGEWDRSWYRFEEMFPETNPERVDRGEALIRLMKRFAYRSVKFTPAMAKSFFRRPIKEIREALKTLTDDGTLVPDGEGLVLREDAERLPAQKPEGPPANLRASPQRFSGQMRGGAVAGDIPASYLRFSAVSSDRRRACRCGLGAFQKRSICFGGRPRRFAGRRKAVPLGRNHRGGVRGKRPGKKPFAPI